MKRHLVLTLAMAASCIAGGARAGEHDRGPMLPAYRQECSACHVAYPRAMLPPPSWQRIMSNLSSHFGTDASIDDAEARQIGVWLAAASPREQAVPAEDRITRSAWFIRKHREVPATTWKRPAVRTAANCAACHTQAEQGRFDEHDVRIPR